MLDDGSVLAFDTSNGAMSREPVDAPCVELPANMAERPAIYARRYRPVRFLPATMPSASCGVWSVTHLGGGDSFEVPDPCAALALGDGSAVAADLAPVAVVRTDRGALVVAQKRRGHPLPVLALVGANGKLVWSVAPPVGNDGAPERIAIDSAEVALLYDDGDGTHLFSWTLDTGRPLRDVVVTRGARWLEAGRGEWLVAGRSAAFGVNEATGALRPIVGGLESAEPEWSLGAKVPKGYVAETRSTPEWGSVAGGLAVFSGTMAINAVLYATLDDRAHLWPLLVPGVGPFIALGTIPQADQGVFTGLLLDAAAQALGILWFSFGAFTTTTTLQPIQPALGLGTVGVRGAF